MFCLKRLINKTIIINNNEKYMNLIKLMSNPKRFKYLTQTEVENMSVIYKGSHPKRPNDPRIGFSSESSQASQQKSDRKSRKDAISKAMKAYLERAQQYDTFMADQDREFQIGKRHLANIMAMNEEDMTQHHIDIAIQYLMPSGLFDKKARPVMRPPREVYPKKKEAQFDTEGRPFHHMFYTGKQNFYNTCYEIAEQLELLNDFEDRLIRKGITEPPDDAKIELYSSEWVSYHEMKNLFLEKFDENKYQNLIYALDRLVSHPYSKRSDDFIMKYRKEVKAVTDQMDVPPLMHDHTGRPYMTARGFRKYCVADVIVRGNGTGKVDINGKDILYFECIQDREQVMTPLTFTNLLFKVDIECKTMHEELTKTWSKDSPAVGFASSKIRELGTTAQSGSIRHALSLALRSFVDKDMVEKMRIRGLLTKDVRTRERKKWGQEGARRKYTWKKR